MRYDAVFGHFLHRTLWCSLAKTINTSHLIFAVIFAVWCGLEFSQNRNRTAPHLIFAVICTILCIKCGLKSVYFSNFGLFLLSSKLIFSFFLAKF